jgi:hypothetical protein
MADWKFKIDIKPFFTPYDTLRGFEPLPAPFKASVMAELRKIPYSLSPGLHALVDQLDGAKDWTINRFNDWLETVYDICDRDLVWLGL